MSDQTFDSLAGRVSEATLRAVRKMGFTFMTKIQAEAIPPLLQGRYFLYSFHLLINSHI